MMDLTIADENSLGELYLKVFDLTSDAVLVYTPKGLLRQNEAAKQAFSQYGGNLQQNIPLYFCTNQSFGHLPEHNMAVQWDYLQNSSFNKGDRYTFAPATNKTLEANLTIEMVNTDRQSFCIFIFSNIRQSGLFDLSGETQIENLLNTIPFDIWVVNKSYQVIHQNNTSKQKWGLYKGMSLDQKIDNPAIVENWEQKYEHVLSIQEAVESELVHTYHNQQTIVREILAPYYNSAGDVGGIIGINIDLTHIKNIEQSLCDSENRYRTVAELSGSIIYEYKLNQNHLTWQGPVLQITGYAREELNSFGFEWHIAMIHPDDRQRVVTAFEQAIIEHTPIYTEFRYRKKNGDYMVVEEVGYVFYDDNNHPTHVIGSKRDITARKEAEIRLEESELWYRNLFEKANDAIFVIEDKLVVDCNPKAISVFGRDKSQLVGQYGLTYSCETQTDGRSSYDSVLQLLERVEAGESCFYEWMFYRPDGSVFDAEVSLSMVQLPSRKLILAIVRDVSVRKAIEKELQTSEKRYHSLFYTMFNGFIVMSPIFDPTGKLVNARFVDANPYYLNHIGKKREEVIGQTIDKISGGHAIWLHHYEKVLKTGKSESFDGYHPHFKGHFRVKAFKPSDDYFAVMFDDITQQVLAEEVLHQNQKKYQMLFDNMHSACTINMPFFDNEGRLIDFEYVEVNSAFEIQSGVPAQRIHGKRLSELVSNFDKSWLDIYDRVWQTGIPVYIEKYSVELKRHFKMNVFKQSEHYFTIIFDDITELKNTEQQIIDTIVEVEERERRQLASDLHDDIGPQLVSMQLYLTTLVRMGLTDDQKEIHKTVIQLLDQTIASLRSISANLSPALLHRFGLAAAVNAECDYARVMFVVDFKSNIQNLRFHKKTEAMIYRIVKELLNNTKKYADASMATLAIIYGNDSLSLVYTDNGKGFDYSETIHSKHTGMGLSNIDMRVKSMNGTSSFKPNPLGEGVYFELSVPVHFSQVQTKQACL